MAFARSAVLPERSARAKSGSTALLRDFAKASQVVCSLPATRRPSLGIGEPDVQGVDRCALFGHIGTVEVSLPAEPDYTE